MGSSIVSKIFYPMDYDHYARPEAYPAPEKMAAMAFNHLKNYSGEVIDWGCGTGLSGRPFLEKGFVVDGVDFSSNAIKRAKKKGYRHVYEKNLLEDDMGDLGKYDVSLSVGIMAVFVPPRIMLPQMIASAKDTSMLAFASETYHTSMDEVKKTLVDSGFAINSIEKAIGFRPMGVKYTYVVATR
jgi:predicted TPR repeat methyltransferase